MLGAIRSVASSRGRGAVKEPYVSSSTTRRARPDDGPHFGPPRTRHGGPVSASARLLPPGGGEGVRSDTRRDAQAGVPSAGRPRAQLAFKDSMVHGILQFTPSIAFRYVLHRCESLDIRCRESYGSTTFLCGRAPPRRGSSRARYTVFLGAHRAGGSLCRRAGPGTRAAGAVRCPGPTGRTGAPRPRAGALQR